jgi:hypothetical protein
MPITSSPRVGPVPSSSARANAAASLFEVYDALCAFHPADTKVVTIISRLAQKGDA